MTQLDPIDRRILAQLQQDSDVSLDALGEAVGLSRNACWRRVKHLESTGVIRKRVALLDPDRLDLKLSVFIQIRTRHHDAAWLEKFARAIEATPEVKAQMQRVEMLTEKVEPFTREGKEPPKELAEEYEGLLSSIQAHPKYQQVVAAQSNFDKIMLQVNEKIVEGIRKGGESSIIIPG